MSSFQRFSIKSIRLTALICCFSLLLVGCSSSSSSDDSSDPLNGDTADGSSADGSNNNDGNNNVNVSFAGDGNGNGNGNDNGNGNADGNANGNGDDNDASNLTNATGGTIPTNLRPVQAELEILADKTFRIAWQIAPNATFYRVLENPDSVSGFDDISGNLSTTTTNFDHRVALFARVNAQYLVQACNDDGCVDSNTVFANVSLNNAINYFKSFNPSNTSSQSDEFGVSVSLSADGNTLAVGAPSGGTAASGADDTVAGGAGNVYVFLRLNSLWQQQAFVEGSNIEDSDRFGFSVSLSADGNTLAVGAPGEASAATGVSIGGSDGQNDNSARQSGAVYVFDRSNEIWRQRAYIKASNTEAFARFGWDVSLSSDGTTLAVGARDDDDGFTGVGAVYVFAQDNRTWEQQAFLKTGTSAGNDRFGDVVSLSGDGNTLAIGNASDDSAATGINGDPLDSSAEQSGAAYVYVRNGEAWQQEAYIKASNTDARDEFGRTLSLSADGNTLAVGAPLEDSLSSGIDGDTTDNSGVESGAAYLFVREGETWQQQTYIKSSNAAVSDVFGATVGLSADGNTLAVGAVGEDSSATGLDGDEFDGSASNAGAAYVFSFSSGTWQQSAYIKASNTSTQDIFGDALSLNADGSSLAVGARHEDSAAQGINPTNGAQSDNSSQDAGAVYLY